MAEGSDWDESRVGSRAESLVGSRAESPVGGGSAERKSPVVGGAEEVKTEGHVP